MRSAGKTGTIIIIILALIGPLIAGDGNGSMILIVAESLWSVSSLMWMLGTIEDRPIDINRSSLIRNVVV